MRLRKGDEIYLIDKGRKRTLCGGGKKKPSGIIAEKALFFETF